MRRLHYILLLLCLAQITARADERRVVVLANGNMPESVELARYYLSARELSDERLCVLDLPTGEQMSRVQYHQQLREPLLAFLRERGWIEQERRPNQMIDGHETPWITTASTVDYVVSVYGVPLRIGDTRFRLMTRVTDRLGHPRFKNLAALDSELALLLSKPYDIAGPAPNPLFARILLSRQAEDRSFILTTARLDGPNPDVVRRMIDDTLFAERYGLHGRMVFDARGLAGGAYFPGDYWIREAQAQFVRLGYETEIDMQEEVLATGYPIEDVALYFGWYTEHMTGALARENFRFRPGAIAYHIHSASASTLRSERRYWAGPLVARGAAFTMGAVSEPFLTYTPELNILAERLVSGYTIGDAVLLSQRTLSWQITVIGDPLYQPFATPLSEQIARLREEGRPEIEWAYVRQANLMIMQGRFNPALAFLRGALRETDSLVIREKLGDLYVMNELYNEAGRHYEEIVNRAKTAETAVRVGARWIHVLQRLGQFERGERMKQKLKNDWPDSAAILWLDQF